MAGTGGLGGYVLDAQTSGLTNQVFVGVAAGGLLGWLLNGLFLVVGPHADALAGGHGGRIMTAQMLAPSLAAGRRRSVRRRDLGRRAVGGS